MSDQIELHVTKSATPGSQPTTELVTPSYVVAPRGAWDGVVARAFADAARMDFEFFVGWKGGSEAKATVRMNPVSPTADRSLKDLAPPAPRFVPRTLRVRFGDAVREVLVIPELHARAAWGVLALAGIVGLCRLLSAAWALEKSVTNVVVLALGGVAVTSGIATKAKAILSWFQRDDLPLLGVFPPLVPVAGGLGLAFVAATVGVTAAGSVITNASQADTQHDLGMKVDPDDSVLAVGFRMPDAVAKLVLVPGTPSETDPLWMRVVSLGWAPQRYKAQCRPILFADDPARIRSGATGLETKDGHVQVSQGADCSVAPLSGIVLGGPGPKAPAAVDLAVRVTLPWVTTEPAETGSFSFAAPSSADPVWVRSVPADGGGIAWIAGRSDRTAPVEVPWRATSAKFESSDDLGGPATGRLSPLRCDDPLRLLRLSVPTDLLDALDLSTASSVNVMHWERGEGAGRFAVIACGTGEDLTLDFHNSPEPKALELDIPETLGVRTVHVRVHGEEIGAAQCPASGPLLLALAREQQRCIQGAAPKGIPAIWRRQGTHAWTSPWICVPRGADPVAVMVDGDRPFHGVAEYANGAWQVLRSCGRFCPCMLGDQSVDLSHCKACIPTNRHFPNCEAATECLAQ